MPMFDEPMDLLEPEFKEPFLNWQQKQTPENTSALLKSIHPVLTAALRTYGIPKSPTLQSRAKIIALDAMKRYDPSKAKLKTHLMFQLQGLRRHAAKETQILSVPEQVGLDINYVHEAENELRDKLGREPSMSELADKTMLSLKRLAYIKKARPSYAEGSFQRSTNEGEDVYSPAVLGGDQSKQWLEFIYHDMSPIEQVILEHSAGLHGRKVLSNIALARKLGITPGAVSQRKAKIQKMIDMSSQYGLF